MEPEVRHQTLCPSASLPAPEPQSAETRPPLPALSTQGLHRKLRNDGHPCWPGPTPSGLLRALVPPLRRPRSWGNQTHGLQSIHQGQRCATLCSQVMREAHLPEPCDLSWQQWASSVGVAQWASSQPARGSAEKEGRWQGLLRAPGNHAGSPQVCLVCALPIQMSPWWLPAQCLNTTCPSPCPYACHKQ